MDLKEARKAYYDHSGNASDITRTLSFSGIAIIWVFRIEVGETTFIPDGLLLSGLFIVISLTFDIAHYICGAIVWGVFSRCMERKGTRESATFLAPRWINWPANVAFGIKLVAIAVAYVFLLSFLIRSLI